MATTKNPPDNALYVYLAAEDLYRLGNASSSKLDNVRADDVATGIENGITMVRATGVGVSVGTEAYLNKIGLSGWLWKIPIASKFPEGLILREDTQADRSGHFFLCPASDMPLDKYRGLLAEVALKCERIKKI